MAHKKGQRSSRNGRDSPGQRRGVKVYGSEEVRAGNILVRQVGTKFHPGDGEDYGDTGLVQFTVTPDCTGTRYIEASNVAYPDVCEEVPPPMMRPIIAVGGSESGHIAAEYLETTEGDNATVMPQGRINTIGNCSSHMSPLCGVALAWTDVIPVTFALPIEVAQVFDP